MSRWDSNDNDEVNSCGCGHHSQITCAYLTNLRDEKRREENKKNGILECTISPSLIERVTKTMQSMNDEDNVWAYVWSYWGAGKSIEIGHKLLPAHKFEGPETRKQRGERLLDFIMRIRFVFHRLQLLKKLDLPASEILQEKTELILQGSIPQIVHGLQVLWIAFQQPTSWTVPQLTKLYHEIGVTMFSELQSTFIYAELERQHAGDQDKQETVKAIGAAWMEEEKCPSPEMFCQWLKQPVSQLRIFDASNQAIREWIQTLQTGAQTWLTDTAPHTHVQVSSAEEIGGRVGHSIEATRELRREGFYMEHVEIETILVRMLKHMRVSLKKEQVTPWIPDSTTQLWLHEVSCSIQLVDSGAVKLEDKVNICIKGVFYV